MAHRPHRIFDESAEVERSLAEEDDEVFDRMAFAHQALDLARVKSTRIVLCEGRGRVRLEQGRTWGNKTVARWAMLSVPKRASRRAIAMAVAELAWGAPLPYALDLLLGPHAYR